MVFQTKKLAIETLGEYLQEIRTDLGLSIKEVATKTAIAEKFLKDLESGHFYKLPPDVYILGFLHKLSALYSISESQVVAQYQKERGILEQVSRDKAKDSASFRSYLSKLIITPKLLSLTIGIAGVLAIVIYLTASVAAIDRNPTLEILEPANGSVIKDGSIKVVGKTDPGTGVVINEQEVFVNGEGKFEVTLGAVAGQKVLDIKAKNKFDRETRNQILVVVEPPADLADASAPAASPDLALHLKYSKETVRTITLDGGTPERKTMAKDSTEDISAKSGILLETEDAGSIEATLNDQELGKLGRSKEHLSIPFSKNSLLAN
jgi:transcriptional regulator with XRE-family HTH domain